uniref:Uncharacterized protein n=1 Tax=Triticum urartu TaxID=4572 RepID=A0A8R7UEU1_TRIUA
QSPSPIAPLLPPSPRRRHRQRSPRSLPPPSPSLRSSSPSPLPPTSRSSRVPRPRTVLLYSFCGDAAAADYSPSSFLQHYSPTSPLASPSRTRRGPVVPLSPSCSGPTRSRTHSPAHPSSLSATPATCSCSSPTPPLVSAPSVSSASAPRTLTPSSSFEVAGTTTAGAPVREETTRTPTSHAGPARRPPPQHQQQQYPQGTRPPAPTRISAAAPW